MLAIQYVDFEKMGDVKEEEWKRGLTQNAIDNDIKFYAIGVIKSGFFSQIFLWASASSYSIEFFWTNMQEIVCQNPYYLSG